MLLEDCRNGKNNWVTNVKSLLENFGFAYVWLNPTTVNPVSFHIMFKKRVLDCFTQNWSESIAVSGVLSSYKHFKVDFELEPYLDILPKKIRFYIAKLRLSSHPLKIETGRYGINRIERHERLCDYCDTMNSILY